MATESPIRILEGTEKWTPLKQSTQYGRSSSKITIEDLGLFIKGQRFQSLEKDVIPSRSESAPPSMEGSIEAVENIFSGRKSTLNPSLVYPSISTINSESKLQFHADPSLSSCHGSAVVLDQMVCGPLNSNDSCHLFQISGRTHSDWKMTPNAKSVGSSAGLSRNSLPVHEEEPEDDGSFKQSASLSSEKVALLGYNSVSLDSRQESSHLASSPMHDSDHSLSYKSMEEAVVCGVESDCLKNLSVSTLTACINEPSSDDRRQVSTTEAHNKAGYNVDVTTASNSDCDKFQKKEQFIPQSNMLQHQTAPKESNPSRVQSFHSQMIYPGISQSYGGLNQFHYGSLSVSATEGQQPILHSSGFIPPLYATPTPFMTSTSPFHPNLQPPGFFIPQYSMGGYAFNSAVLPSYLPGFPHQGVIPVAFNHASPPTSGVSDGGNPHAYNMQNLKLSSHVGVPLQPSISDFFHMQFLQLPVQDLYGTYGHFDHQLSGDGAIVNQVDSRDLKKIAGLGLSKAHKTQPLAVAGCNTFNLQGGNISSHYSLGSPTNVGPVMQFPAASAVSPAVPAKPVGSTYYHAGRYSTSHVHSSDNCKKTYGIQSQSWNDTDVYSFLEDLKLGKGQRFELPDISGHIGDFSVDQHGSRFIQQKLESCSVEEKALVFNEVVPNASKLMTDVFGNYVIQKLFEYGSPEQRKDLADQLKGQILQLSLQMYGCRVIQMAIEVIDLEQKSRLVRELDGHVMRCVYDQNGNHVIQKCIESIPTDNIHFIISSFRGQVATLSMHPYGCRVIQRVLEHYKDEIQIQFIVDEILDSICSLAQDQYGNYVTQHVLERGKPRERSEIIKKLSGSIVQLSQHKFASNVIEKCLEYTDSTARGILIQEIIGDGDKNDNLLVMMKDQYANYVIQRILQKCSGDQQEMLLGLIRNHLMALKKYTYGKHIVARFEKLYGEEIQTSES